MRALRSLSLGLFVVLAMVAAGCSDSKTETSPVVGDWNGKIEIPDHPLEVGVTFGSDGKATVDIPTQAVVGKPLTDVRTGNDDVGFTAPDFPGTPTFKGKYDKASDSIAGDFTQSGQTVPLHLTRGRLASMARPQQPQPPWPYRSEDVSYRSGDITIAGTLTEPKTGGPHPAVVLVTGSGAQNRDEELLGHKPFLLLADTFTRAGYAVLRTDDRGVGGTGGDLSQSDYQQLADDIGAGITFLHGRSEIDGKRIGLLGHSEGGYLAPLYAARPDSGVAFVIMQAGPAVTGADVLLEQNRIILTAQGATPEQISEQLAYVSGLVDIVHTGDLAAAKKYAQQHNDSLPPERKQPEAAIDQLVSPYMAALINYDPAPALSALRVPVLAVYGTKDVQVPATQSEGPARALLAADPDATVHVFDGLNHLMQPAQSGLLTEYATIGTTVDPQVLDMYTNWLTQRFPPKR
ncbi:alpha/beta fold hydrolase [Nocardia sp. NBC_01503]|uniref:alpha/beta hydrolase family protein n=1 Tax=Nocardia sp. NBC_01503 TaxID=2975997 RepID=UPI002E7BA8EA|nr:alpha/beta fold hydrolase [Nocardia sp. NBC_01503]WTL32476.1 alpha/beta fold hydrolase [Nocardia sp. NBC_01503]